MLIILVKSVIYTFPILEIFGKNFFNLILKMIIALIIKKL